MRRGVEAAFQMCWFAFSEKQVRVAATNVLGRNSTFRGRGELGGGASFQSPLVMGTLLIWHSLSSNMSKYERSFVWYHIEYVFFWTTKCLCYLWCRLLSSAFFPPSVCRSSAFPLQSKMKYRSSSSMLKSCQFMTFYWVLCLYPTSQTLDGPYLLFSLYFHAIVRDQNYKWKQMELSGKMQKKFCIFDFSK